MKLTDLVKKSALSIENFEKTTYASYRIVTGVLTALIVFSVYLFSFSLILLIICGFAVLNLVVIVCKNKWCKSKTNFYPDQHALTVLVLFTSAIAIPVHYFGFFASHSAYADFLVNLREFLLSHISINKPYFHPMDFINGTWQFVISGGYLLEVAMLIFQIVSIYLFYKTAYAFFYIWRNDEEILQDRLGHRHRDDQEKRDKFRAMAIRVMVEYEKPRRALFVFSTGIPYLVILCLISVAEAAN